MRIAFLAFVVVFAWSLVGVILHIGTGHWDVPEPPPEQPVRDLDVEV